MALITAVIDTADWPLAVPLQAAPGTVLDFSNTYLSATVRPILGGDAITSADSDPGGGLSFVPASGDVPAYFALDLPVVTRPWRISRPTTVVADVLRHPVPGGDAVEWLGRITLRIIPGSDSSGIAQAAQTPVLIDAQPYDGRIATQPLVIGPQGPNPLPPLPSDAAMKTYDLRAVSGVLTWVAVS